MPSNKLQAQDSPWYREGLRFECVPDCGACCTDHQDYAYVYLSESDVERLADFLELTPGAFRRQYTEVDEDDRVLRMDQPACPFLEGCHCRVYPVRPTQCRTFPFWSENLETPRRWKRLGDFCPGIDNGERHSLHVIQGYLRSRE